MEKNLFTENPPIISVSPNEFSEVVLGNDACASAVILTGLHHGIDLRKDSSSYRWTQPSICPSEDNDGRIAAGVQTSFVVTEGNSTYKTWLYTDLFFFNPDGTDITPGKFLVEAVDDVAESERQQVIDTACNTWLYAMKRLYGESEGSFYYGETTGEVRFGTFDLIPGTAKSVILPNHMGGLALGNSNDV